MGLGWQELGHFGLSALGALALGLALLAAFGAGLHYERRVKRWLLPLVLAAIVLAPPLSELVLGRDLRKLALLGAGATIDPSGAAAWLLRLATGGIVFAAMVRVVSRWMRPAGVDVPGTALFVGFVAYFASNVLLPGLFGTRPSVTLQMFYPLAVVAALHVSRHYGPRDLLDAVKWALLAMLLASVLASFVAPNLALQFDKVDARLPGVKFRMWGLGSNPNSVAALGLLLVMLTIHNPFRQVGLSVLALVVGAAVVLLAQSQTVWGAAALVLPPYVMYRLRNRRGNRRRSAREAATLGAGRWMFGIVLAALAVLAFAVLAARFGTGQGVLADIGNTVQASRRGQEISTLTGRVQIWVIALEMFRANPLFGYGPTLWDQAFRATWRVPEAVHAHNQWMQSLGVGGALGLLGLLAYQALLVTYAWIARRASRGLSLALVAVILIRSITEVPFDLSTILLSNFLLQLVLFTTLVGYTVRAAERATQRSRRRAGARRADADDEVWDDDAEAHADGPAGSGRFGPTRFGDTVFAATRFADDADDDEPPRARRRGGGQDGGDGDRTRRDGDRTWRDGDRTWRDGDRTRRDGGRAGEPSFRDEESRGSRARGGGSSGDRFGGGRFGGDRFGGGRFGGDERYGDDDYGGARAGGGRS